jgi:uncharacterized protein YeaO (DUF488 family)
MRRREERDVPTIQLKRIYEPADAQDGLRVLVDRLWPRGMSKGAAHLDAWMRDLGPSDELRQWFGHRAERWTAFQERYRRELSAPRRQLYLALLHSAARTSTVTLLYGARDYHQNEAVVLRDYLLDQRGAPGHPDSDMLTLLAAVAAVAAAQPSGKAPVSNLRPFLAVLPLVPELEAALQALRDRGAVQEGHDGWRLTARGERLLRDGPTGSAG